MVAETNLNDKNGQTHNYHCTQIDIVIKNQRYSNKIRMVSAKKQKVWRSQVMSLLSKSLEWIWSHVNIIRCDIYKKYPHWWSSMEDHDPSIVFCHNHRVSTISWGLGSFFHLDLESIVYLCFINFFYINKCVLYLHVWMSECQLTIYGVQETPQGLLG